MGEESRLIGLSTALEGLRDELERAWRASADKNIRFRVGEVTLTVEAVARREAGGEAKIRWWLVEAGGSAKTGSETTQTLVLTLSPQLYGEDKVAGPLDVGDPQADPEG
jgi:Trypsin-co-occurring domain 2